MDSQWAFNIAMTLAGALGGFVLSATWNAVIKLQADHQALQKSISDTYLRRDDFRIHAERIEAMLIRIENKLDDKADKP